MNIEEAKIIVDLKECVELVDTDDKNLLLDIISKVNLIMTQLEKSKGIEDRDFYMLGAMIVKEKALDGVNKCG
jgi:hypothetical protein